MKHGICNLRDFKIDKLTEVMQKISQNGRIIIISLSITLYFFILYSSMGFILNKTSAFSRNNLLFELDVPRVIGDMTSLSSSHYRTKVHPIYVLLINPAGYGIAHIVHNERISAIMLNSFISSLNVALAFLFFFLFNRDYLFSLLFSLMFGFSMSQFVLGSIPDTSSLATFSLMITYLIFVSSITKKKLFFNLWCMAGILSLGITVTNIIQTTICFIFALFVIEDKKYLYKNIIVYVLLVFGTVILLSIFQKVIYPSSEQFFIVPNSYQEEYLYLNFSIIYHPINTIIELMKHFFVANIIGPIPNIFILPVDAKHAITFAGTIKLFPIGWIALVVWVFMIIKSAYLRVNVSIDKTFIYGILSCIVFNLILHIFYAVNEVGKMEIFAYTGNYTFLILVYISCYLTSSKLLFLKSVLLIMILIMAFNNALVMNYIANIFK